MDLFIAKTFIERGLSALSVLLALGYGVHTSRISFENPAFAPPAPQVWGEKYKILGHFPPELGG
jgi:hypothetical protein